MARLDIRCDLNLPVEILSNSSSMAQQRGNTVNIGLGGAFISANRLVPEDSVVELKAQIPDYGSLQAKGKVLRKQAEGFALKFLNLDTATKANLWDYISGNLYEPVDYPDNGGSSASVSPMALPMHRAEEISFRLKILDKAVDGFNRKLSDIEHSCNGESPDELMREVSASMHEVFDVCRGFETAVGENTELIKRAQVEFRQKTDPIFSKSNLMSHARTWPKGYPGDYKMLENVYRNMSLSEGIGYLLDSYFLTRTLAVAVRGRLVKLTEILKDEIQTREKPCVLNVACGSCREVFGIVPEIGQSGAKVTCIDFDSGALHYASNRLSYAELGAQLTLRKYNTLRMINQERNMKEFGPQDIIYSSGLFVYLEDDVLVRLVRGLYELLRPKGKLIITFEDSDRYDTHDYHWLVDWDSLLLRNEHDCRKLFNKAGIPEHSLRVERDRTGVIMLFIVDKG
jgi:SAM-dependent methyltransferase